MERGLAICYSFRKKSVCANTTLLNRGNAGFSSRKEKSIGLIYVHDKKPFLWKSNKNYRLWVFVTWQFVELRTFCPASKHLCRLRTIWKHLSFQKHHAFSNYRNGKFSSQISTKHERPPPPHSCSSSSKAPHTVIKVFIGVPVCHTAI